jgi:hypothetical protein
MMSITFPAAGSLYYAQDLEKVAGGPRIPLVDERFWTVKKLHINDESS